MADRSGNLLLDQLPGGERERLLEQMELVPLEMRDTLAERGKPMARVYFPQRGIISIITILHNGDAVEAASLGWEGMAGIEVFLGGQGPDNVRLICQVEGKAWAMDASRFREESRVEGPLRTVMERYVRTMFVQTTQSAACNGSHLVEERLAKWLALIEDWSGEPEFPLTHDFAAALLGVHRPSVTLAAGALQRAGVINYRRGQVQILDGDALRQVSCECYGVIRRAYDDLRKPAANDGPGAVSRYAALLDSALQNQRRSLLVGARSKRLMKLSARVAART